MDPVTILTLVQTASGLSFEIIMSLYSFAKEIKEVDSSLKALIDEVKGLKCTLIAITKSLNDPVLRLPEMCGNTEVWAAIYASVAGC